MGNVFSAKDVTLRELITFAYKPTYDVDYVVAGWPAWTDADHSNT